MGPVSYTGKLFREVFQASRICSKGNEAGDPSTVRRPPVHGMSTYIIRM